LGYNYFGLAGIAINEFTDQTPPVLLTLLLQSSSPHYAPFSRGPKCWVLVWGAPGQHWERWARCLSLSKPAWPLSVASRDRASETGWSSAVFKSLLVSRRNIWNYGKQSESKILGPSGCHYKLCSQKCSLYLVLLNV